MEIREYYLFVVFAFLIFISGCEKDTAPLLSRQPELSLTAEDFTCTEAWLRVQAGNLLGWDVLKVSRDDSVIYTGRPGPADTLLYDAGLLPSRQYSYRASLLRNHNLMKEKALFSITTLDTTSHEFDWEVIEFPSPYGSGTFFDAAVINENDIWACGEINASGGPYNAVHWDGQQWELKRIPFIGTCSAVDYPPIRAIWAFSEDNILFTNGGAIAKYNGSATYLDCGMNALLDGAIGKIFATDPSNVYAVGGVGTIVHYNGSSWQKLYSGTALNIYDIWGDVNPLTGKTEILAVASSWPGSVGEVQVLSIHDYRVTPVSVAGLAPAMTDLWFVPGKRYYVVGDGVYYTRKPGEPWVHETEFPSLFKCGIRGQGINDIIIVGAFGLVSHFNGLTWHHYMGKELSLFDGVYGSLAYKESIMVAVGQKGVNGIILKGTHKP